MNQNDTHFNGDAKAKHAPLPVAIQLGLRGSALAQFASDALIEVIDMSAFVAAQRPFAHDDSAELMTPVEDVYPHDGLLNEAQ